MSPPPRDPADGAGPDQPDRWSRTPSSHLDPADPRLLEHLGIVVPDDASALDGLAASMLHPSRSRWRGAAALLGLTRRSPRGDRPGGERRSQAPRPLQALAAMGLVMLLAMAVLMSSLLGSLQTRGTSALPSNPGALPLADPPLSDGPIGALLPDAGVSIDGAWGASTRDLRPAVMVIPPAGPCDSCADLVATLGRQAAEYRMPVFVAGPATELTRAREYVEDSGRASVHVLGDSAGVLHATFGDATTPRAVLVHADGVVGGVLDDPAPDERYEQVLSPLRTAGAVDAANLPDAPTTR